MDFFQIIETAKIPQWKDKYITAEKYQSTIDGSKSKQLHLEACAALINLLNEDCILINHFFVLLNSNIEKRYNYFINSFYKVFYKKIEKNENLKKMLDESMKDNTNQVSTHITQSGDSVVIEKNEKSVKSIFENLVSLFNNRISSEDSDKQESTDSLSKNHFKQNLVIVEHIYAQKAFEILLEIYMLNSFIEMNRSAVTVISNYADKSFLTRTFHENQQKLSAQFTFFHDSTIMSICKKIQTIYHIYSFLTGYSLIESKNIFLDYYNQTIVHEKTILEGNSVQTNSNDETPFGIAANCLKDQNKSKISYLPLAKLIIFIIIISVLLNVQIFKDSAQTRGLALLTGCVFLWVTEAMELWVTAILIPILTVLFNVLKSNDGAILPASESSKIVFQSMFSSMIMVLLAGFSLSKALEKFKITKLLAEHIIHLCGKNPKKLLLGVMLLAWFLSMWISNIAAPVLCYSLIKPILFSLPKKSSSSTAFILAIAFASNIGGMSSPIASPQNIITLEIMGEQQPAWGIWFVISLPVCLFSLLSIWLLLAFSCNFKDITLEHEKTKNEKMKKVQIFICLVFLLTVGLWCVLTQTKQFFGSSGIVACIPIVILFGLKILTLEDLKSFHWNIIFLAMGANVLGLAMNNCKLLETLGTFLINKLHNVSFYGIFLILCLFVLAIASVVSHTISVIVLAPLIKQIGDSLSPPRSSILLISTALIASAAMILPTSSFPNISAISLLDSNGDRYIYLWTFIKFGIISTCFCFCLIISLGFAIMLALGY